MRKSQPLIGVCIPTFNDGNYLFESVQSILNQTYKNFVIYIINDGSEIKWHNLYKKAFSNNKKIIYSYQKNLGIVQTSQKLLNLCKENKKVKFIARMDADDISHPKRFEYQIDLILKNKFELVGCHFKRMNANKKIFEENLAPLNNIHFFLHLLIGSPFAHGSIIFSKNILKKKIDYTTANKNLSIFPEDYNFYIKCWHTNVKIGTVNKFLYFHRYHNSSYSMINKKIYNLNLSQARNIFFKNCFLGIDKLLKKKLFLKNIYIKVILVKFILIYRTKLSYNILTKILSLFKTYDFFLILKYYCKRKIKKFIYA
jgi:glycosyltransferase involved in cell wall biosynthesis